MTQHLKDILTRIGYDVGSIEALNGLEERMSGRADWAEVLAVPATERPADRDARLKRDIDRIAERYGESPYALGLLYLVLSLPALEELYERRGLAKEYYYDTAYDLLAQTNDCIKGEGVLGTRALLWHMNFFRLERYALGRMEYEDCYFPLSDISVAGYTVRKGQLIVGMHIPSGAPLTLESRLDSYKKAFEFYGCTREKPLIIYCHSWLFNPQHRDMLSEGSNIIDFMDDFEMLSIDRHRGFSDAYRVFGTSRRKPLDEWSTEGALCRGYVRVLKETNETCTAAGILVFDGERILTRKGIRQEERKPVEYRKARAEEADDILDFINYVFSQAHYPHDFRQYNPAMYNSGYPFWKEHYVAVRDGRVKATLSISRTEHDFGGVTLVGGHVGQVSVHPYERGEGHMKQLMSISDEDMRADGFDYAVLNGLRQRYQYFGYTQGGVMYEFEVSATNIRHTLAGRTPTLTFAKPDFLDADGRRAGSLTGNRLTLDDWSLAADACAAYFEATGEKGLCLRAAPYEKDAAAALGAFCEHTVMKTTQQYRVYHFDAVLRAGLGLRARAGLIRDGEATINVEGRAWHIVCRNGSVSVEAGCADDAAELTPMQAQDLMFSPLSNILYPDMPQGWFPITL